MPLRESAPNGASADGSRPDATDVEGPEPGPASGVAAERTSAYVARPLPQLTEGQYRIRFAENGADLERVLRLRFEVFNLEMNEGLESSYETGLDFDAFDLVCDHLMVEEIATGALVGTYRMQSANRHGEGLGLYCAQEFDLSSIPQDVLDRSVELGRACVARAYRNGHVLFSLWRGLSAYCVWTKRRFLFGCCSLTSQDPAEGRAFERYLERKGKAHPTIRVEPWPDYSCGMADPGEGGADEADPEVPTLFGTYLRYGAYSCGAPAIDRAFKTIDFLVLLDLEQLDLRVRRMFFSGIPPYELPAVPDAPTEA